MVDRPWGLSLVGEWCREFLLRGRFATVFARPEAGLSLCEGIFRFSRRSVSISMASFCFCFFCFGFFSLFLFIPCNSSSDHLMIMLVLSPLHSFLIFSSAYPSFQASALHRVVFPRNLRSDH